MCDFEHMLILMMDLAEPHFTLSPFILYLTDVIKCIWGRAYLL